MKKVAGGALAALALALLIGACAASSDQSDGTDDGRAQPEPVTESTNGSDPPPTTQASEETSVVDTETVGPDLSDVGPCTLVPNEDGRTYVNFTATNSTTNMAHHNVAVTFFDDAGVRLTGTDWVVAHVVDPGETVTDNSGVNIDDLAPATCEFTELQRTVVEPAGDVVGSCSLSISGSGGQMTVETTITNNGANRSLRPFVVTKDEAGSRVESLNPAAVEVAPGTITAEATYGLPPGASPTSCDIVLVEE